MFIKDESTGTGVRHLEKLTPKNEKGVKKKKTDAYKEKPSDFLRAKET